MNTNDTTGEKRHPNAPVLLLNWGVLKDVIKTIGSIRAETGGVAGGNGSGSEVCHFSFDESSRNSAVTYSPDYKRLNQLFKDEWNPKGIRLQVIFHSHPGRMGRPSYGDEIYSERILKAIPDLGCLWLPIINTVPDTGMFRLTPWAVYPAASGVSVVKGRVQVVQAPPKSSFAICGINVREAIQLGMPLDEILIGKQEPERSATRLFMPKDTDSAEKKVQHSASPRQFETPDWRTETAKSFNVRETFNRVQNAYDLSLMHKTRIIAVGARRGC